MAKPVAGLNALAQPAIYRHCAFDRHAVRYFLLTFPLCIVLVLTGCGLWKPVLKVAAVGETPRPNGIYESHIWNRAEPLDLRLEHTRGKGNDRLQLRLKAVYDGRAISIFARWLDTTKSSSRWTWVWNRKTREYQLEYTIVDQFTLLFPLDPESRFKCMLSPGPDMTRYDVWRWIGGWSDFAGHANDQVLQVRRSALEPAVRKPEQTYYQIGHSGRLAEFNWINDQGTPASTIRPRPFLKTQSRIPGHESNIPAGSAGDIQVQSVYNPKVLDSPANRFIEFYRLLKTRHSDEDIQLDPSESNIFAVSVHDHSEGADHYVSRPIRLKFDKTPETIYK